MINLYELNSISKNIIFKQAQFFKLIIQKVVEYLRYKPFAKLVNGFFNSEMEFKEFEPRFKSAKTRFKLSAGLNLETFDTILSGTNHI